MLNLRESRFLLLFECSYQLSYECYDRCTYYFFFSSQTHLRAEFSLFFTLSFSICQGVSPMKRNNQHKCCKLMTRSTLIPNAHCSRTHSCLEVCAVESLCNQFGNAMRNIHVRGFLLRTDYITLTSNVATAQAYAATVMRSSERAKENCEQQLSL